MRGESIFQSDKSNSEGRYFILVDALERKGEGLASQAELETLVHEAISEALGKEKTLTEAAVKGAISEANGRLRLACEGESTPPVVSVAVVAQTEGGYLLAGAGDTRIYGVGADKTTLAFADPAGGPAKGGKRSTSRKNRLGCDAELTVHTQKISQKSYEALLALSFDGYIGVEEKSWKGLPYSDKLARDLRRLPTSGQPKGWLLHTGTAPAATATRGGRKRRLAISLAVAAVAVMALVGSGALKRSAPHAVEQEQLVVAEEVLEIDYEQQMEELASLFEAELEAQQSLLSEHKTEVATLWQETEEHERLQEQFLQLSDLLAAETTRIADLESNLVSQQDDLILTKQTLGEREELLSQLQVELEEARLAMAEFEELRQQKEEGAAYISELESSLATSQTLLEQTQEALVASEDEQALHHAYTSSLEDDHAALLEQFTTLSDATRDQEFVLATEQERQEALELELAGLQAQLESALDQRTTLAAKVDELQEREHQQQDLVEEMLTARVELGEQLVALTERNEGLRLEKEELLGTITHLEAVQNEFEQERLARADRDEMLQKISMQMESWKEAMLALEGSRNDLRQELAELRSRQEQLSQGREMIAKADVEAVRAGASHVTRVHLVSPGESLESIAQRYYGSTEKAHVIVEANQETVNNERDVRVGTALVIP